MVPVLELPLADLAPLQLPLAVHEVGLFETDQFIVAALPVPIVVGFMATLTTGLVVVLAADTVRPTLAVPLPPALLQESE